MGKVLPQLTNFNILHLKTDLFLRFFFLASKKKKKCLKEQIKVDFPGKVEV